MFRFLLAVLCAVLLLSCPVRSMANDVTIDSLTLTKKMGNNYQVDYSGTLKLKNIDCDYEKWAFLTLTVYQKGTSVTVSVVSLTQPTLDANGSYSATATVFFNVFDPDWTASAQINVYIDNKMTQDSTTKTKAFKVP